MILSLPGILIVGASVIKVKVTVPEIETGFVDFCPLAFSKS